MEENIWDFIQDRYVNEKFKIKEFSSKYKVQLDKYYNNENKRELKNVMLTSLLIKYICRYLPYQNKENDENDLFEMIIEKNINLSENIINELKELKNIFGAKLKDIIDITLYFVQKNKRNKKIDKDEKEENEEENNNIINEEKKEMENEKNEESEDESESENNENRDGL